MLRVLLPLLLVGCSPQLADPPAPPPTVDERVLAVRQGLSEAHRRWSAGKRDEARALVLATYRENFEPLEPGLRALNGRETLELEYGFALLAERLGRAGNPVEIAAEVRALSGRVETATAALPREPGVAAPPAQPQAPSTVTVPVSPARGADAPGLPTSDKGD